MNLELSKILKDLKNNVGKTFTQEYKNDSFSGKEVMVKQDDLGTSIWSEDGEMNVSKFVRKQMYLNSNEEAEKLLKDKYGLQIVPKNEWVPNDEEIKYYTPVVSKMKPLVIYMPFSEDYYKARFFEKYKDRFYKDYLENKEKKEAIETLFNIEAKLINNAMSPIPKKPALISYQGVPIINQRTVNLIQGQTGVHKSRLATSFIKTLLSPDFNNKLGFQKATPDTIINVLIDTERNHSDELPYVIRDIFNQAKIKFVHSAKQYFNSTQYFRISSLKLAKRKDRLWMLKSYIQKIRGSLHYHIFIVLDVVTDCMFDFNNVNEALELSDYFNQLCEEQDCTILAIIHENPGTGKARGHMGTELMNKSSTNFAVSCYKNETFKLEFKKLRNSGQTESILMRFDKSTNDIKKLSEGEIKKIQASDNMAPVEDVILSLENIFIEPNYETTQQELIESLRKSFDCSPKTISRRISEIVEKGQVIISNEDGNYILTSVSSSGKPTIYKLVKL
jgi:hypothetical protein